MKSNNQKLPVETVPHSTVPIQRFKNSTPGKCSDSTREISERFIAVVNYIIIQHKKKLSSPDDCFWESLVEVYLRFKRGDVVWTGEAGKLYHIVNREMERVTELKTTQRKVQTTQSRAAVKQPVASISDFPLLKPSRDCIASQTTLETIVETHPDQKYIAAFLTNDKIIINEIYEKFTPLIERLVLQNNGTVSDGNDLFQDAMVAICEKAQKGQIVLRARFEHFLYKICKNQWMTKLKGRKRYREIALTENENFCEDSYGITEEAILKHQRSNLFWEKFSQLEDRKIELFILKWCNIPVKHAARVQNLTAGGCRTQRVKARKRLEESIQQSPIFVHLKR